MIPSALLIRIVSQAPPQLRAIIADNSTCRIPVAAPRPPAGAPQAPLLPGAFAGGSVRHPHLSLEHAGGGRCRQRHCRCSLWQSECCSLYAAAAGADPRTAVVSVQSQCCAV